jgi:hypothetical protein
MEAAGSSEDLVTIRLHGVTYGNLHMTAMRTCLFLYSKWLIGTTKFGLCFSLKQERRVSDISWNALRLLDPDA